MDAAPDPSDERTLRRARRALWTFRLIFYPGAAIVGAALLAGTSAAEISVLAGTTGQGRAVRLTLDGGDPDRLTTSVVRRCGDGSEHPAPVEVVELTNRGDAFEFHATRDERWANGKMGTATLDVRGRRDGDTARGTVSLVQRLGSYVCEAETDFSAD